MEPAQATRITFVIPNVKVSRVEERFHKNYLEGFGESTRFEEVSLGWYAVFEGSYEALFLGNEKPDLAKGDHVMIKITKL